VTLVAEEKVQHHNQFENTGSIGENENGIKIYMDRRLQSHPERIEIDVGGLWTLKRLYVVGFDRLANAGYSNG
jgi:hypothetical protein